MMKPERFCFGSSPEALTEQKATVRQKNRTGYEVGRCTQKSPPREKHPCFEEEVRKWGGIYAIYVTTPTRNLSTSRSLSVQ